MQQDLHRYYSNRAKEYESVYSLPERQNDLVKLAELLQKYFDEEEVLEIACGTGYWTQFIAQKAKHILATDFSEDVLEIARTKNLNPAKVTFQNADIYEFEALEKSFNALFGGFIWSHIPIQKLNEFVYSVHSVLQPKAKIFFTDNICGRQQHANFSYR